MDLTSAFSCGTVKLLDNPALRYDRHDNNNPRPYTWFLPEEPALSIPTLTAGLLVPLITKGSSEDQRVRDPRLLPYLPAGLRWYCDGFPSRPSVSYVSLSTDKTSFPAEPVRSGNGSVTRGFVWGNTTLLVEHLLIISQCFIAHHQTEHINKLLTYAMTS